MYMSIVDEMRKPLGTPQGKYWISKLPTTLTILQDKSTGLAVDQALPIFPESDPSKCENPSELEDVSSFDGMQKQIKIVVKLRNIFFKVLLGSKFFGYSNYTFNLTKQSTKV
jgi:hypothetical protein